LCIVGSFAANNTKKLPTIQKARQQLIKEKVFIGFCLCFWAAPITVGAITYGAKTKTTALYLFETV
jgi:hypothetical protein